MSMVREVRKVVQRNEHVIDVELEGALRDAERLADEFSSVKPVPYVVPIERFVGLPILGEHKVDR